MTNRRLLSLAAICIACLSASVKAGPSGVWEGVIQDQARPLVVNVDFDKRIIKIDATGSTEWRLERLTPGEGTIKFTVTVNGRLFQFIGHADAKRIAGEMKTPDRVLSFWLERLPIFSKPRDRVEAWEQDLTTTERFLRYDRSYSDAARRLVRDRIAQLRSAVARMTDQEIMVELARDIALGGNAHTRLYLVRNRTEVKRLPIRVWWFGNELRVVRATEEHKDLLGCVVIKVENLSTKQAAERVRGIKAGNASWQRYMSTYMLTSSDILFGAHIAKWADETNFTFE